MERTKKINLKEFHDVKDEWRPTTRRDGLCSPEHSTVAALIHGPMREAAALAPFQARSQFAPATVSKPPTDIVRDRGDVLVGLIW